MIARLVFSLVGPDRTGLVDRLTQVIVAHGGNLEDSRMAVLGGEFAVIMLVGVEAERRAALQKAMEAAAAELDMLIFAKETAAGPADVPRVDTQVPFAVTVRGMDHEGIAHDVVHVMAGMGISIQDLESSVTAGAFSGTAVFAMEAYVLAPAAVSLADLRARLEEAADRLNVDVDVIARPSRVGAGR